MPVSAGLRRAKRMLHKRFHGNAWYAGTGIIPVDSGLGLRITVSVEPTDRDIPETYYGYPVEVVVMPGYSLRDDRE